MVDRLRQQRKKAILLRSVLALLLCAVQLPSILASEWLATAVDETPLFSPADATDGELLAANPSWPKRPRRRGSACGWAP